MKIKKILASIFLIGILPLAACSNLLTSQSSLNASISSSQLNSDSSTSTSDVVSSSAQNGTASSNVTQTSSSNKSSSSVANSNSSSASRSSTSSASSSSVPSGSSGFSNITEFTAPVEIHTAEQKTYLSYSGSFETISQNLYPDGLSNRSDSKPVDISWNYVAPSGKTVTSYSIISGRNSDLSDGYEISSGLNKNVKYYNPYLGQNYFKLVAKFSDNTKEESIIKSYNVDSTAPRNLAIGGMTNNRDLGGWQLEDGGVIKQGLIYRTSGRNYDLNGANITEDGRKVMLQQLKVKTEVNVSDGDSYTLNLSGTTVKNFYMDYDKQGADSLNHFTRNAESVKNFFELLAQPSNYPVYFHCRIGTDRTGMGSILLQGLLGVSLNEIYQDYLFSNFGKIGEKRNVGSSAGQDNVQVYINFINSLAGKTFKNKVYNCLLSIGLTPETLNAVIANLTEGTPAQNNNSGQIIARAESLSGTGVTVKTDTSDRNNPDKYFTLKSASQSVSYTFTVNNAFTGQIIAYLGKDNSSTTSKIGDAIGLKLDGNNIEIKNQTYHEAGMGKCGTRMNYFPVLLAETSFAAGSHTVTIQGTAVSMNIGGLYIFNKTTV